MKQFKKRVKHREKMQKKQMSLNESDKTGRHKEVKKRLDKSGSAVIKRKKFNNRQNKAKTKTLKFDKLLVESCKTGAHYKRQKA